MLSVINIVSKFGLKHYKLQLEIFIAVFCVGASKHVALRDSHLKSYRLSLR